MLHEYFIVYQAVTFFGTGELMGAKIMEGADRLMKVESYQHILDKRRQVTVAQYEAMLDACSTMDLNGEENTCQPEKWNLRRPVLFLGTQNHKRIYSVNGVRLYDRSEEGKAVARA